MLKGARVCVCVKIVLPARMPRPRGAISTKSMRMSHRIPLFVGVALTCVPVARGREAMAIHNQLRKKHQAAGRPNRKRLRMASQQWSLGAVAGTRCRMVVRSIAVVEMLMPLRLIAFTFN